MQSRRAKPLYTELRAEPPRRAFAELRAKLRAELLYRASSGRKGSKFII